MISTGVSVFHPIKISANPDFPFIMSAIKPAVRAVEIIDRKMHARFLQYMT